MGFLEVPPANQETENAGDWIEVFSGQCQCGAVRAFIRGNPVQVRQCWCQHCQQVAAGGPTHNAIFSSSDISISGQLSHYSYAAASGNTLTQSFCGSCGTPVLARSSANSDFAAIRLGFLNPRSHLVPTHAIWTDEAPAWANIDEELKQFPGQSQPLTR